LILPALLLNPIGCPSHSAIEKTTGSLTVITIIQVKNSVFLAKISRNPLKKYPYDFLLKSWAQGWLDIKT